MHLSVRPSLCVYVCVYACVCVCALQCHPNLENDLLKWNYAAPWPMANGMSCNLSSSWAVNKIWLVIICLYSWSYPIHHCFFLSHFYLPSLFYIMEVLMVWWNITDVVIWGYRAENCDDGKWVVVRLWHGYMKQQELMVMLNAKKDYWSPSKGWLCVWVWRFGFFTVCGSVKLHRLTSRLVLILVVVFSPCSSFHFKDWFICFRLSFFSMAITLPEWC